jgi:sigma-B regulation protein RsbU (phosphoserine phosphatase)
VYTNAGHPHAFVIRANGDPERLVATDPPVGFASADSYREVSVPWHERDLLVLFTDGLPDALTGVDRQGAERLLLDAVKKNRMRPARDIVEALFELSAEREPSPLGDDRTALVLRR